jgi:hypothetical protein
VLPKADQCIFCGAEGISEEHIFSRKWLKRIWSVQTGEKLRHRNVRDHSERGEEFDRAYAKREADLVVYCVCTGCNSGWMNRLDQAVYPIVDPMVSGAQSTIATLANQMTLVHWAMKVAFMFDYRQDKSTLPGELARGFRRHWTMPPRTRIWLARNVPLHEGEASGAFHTMGRGDDDHRLYLCTFRVDQMIVQILHGIGEEIRPNRLRHEQHVVQIWPPSYLRVRWPPPVTLDEFEYAAFCHAFVRDFMSR